MRYRQYPRYTRSAAEWLGQVPSTWGSAPLKYSATFVNGMAFKPDAWSDDGVPIIRIENLNGSPAFNCFEGAVEPRYHVTRGDLLFGWSGNRGTSFGPFLWWRDGLHYLNQHIFKLIDLRCDKAWLYWCLKAVTRTIEDEAHGIIGMVHVTRGKLGGVQIPTPPEEEQRAIGSFLDGQVAKLNELVARKRQLIEKLEEKRAALISRTIARGLPPDAALAAGINPRPGSRPSGTAWLGDVPGHWTVRPLMYLVEANRPIMYGIVLPGPDVDDGVPIVKGGDVKPGRLTLDNLCRTTPEIEAGYARSRLKPGDIVFSIRGTVGEVELVPAEVEGANLTQDAARVAPARGIDNRWLLYALKARAVIDPLLALSLGAAVRGVNIRDLKRVRVPTPPAAEQMAIADYLDRETARMDRMAAKVDVAIERLLEYRSALITAAVTGQIDVRGQGTPGLPAAAGSG